MNQILSSYDSTLLMDLIERGTGIFSEIAKKESSPKYPILHQEHEMFKNVNRAHADRFFTWLLSEALSLSVKSDSKKIRDYWSSVEISEISSLLRIPKADDRQAKLRKHILANRNLSQDMLLSKLKNLLSVNIVELENFNLKQDYYFSKINHGYWEQITRINLNDVQYAGFRGNIIREVMHSYYEKGHFNTFFFELFENDFLSKGALISEQQTYDVGVSINGGNKPFTKSMALPLDPVAHGASVGILSLLQTLNVSEKRHIVDGNAAKRLCSEDLLDVFVKNALVDTDAVIFLVPQHLQNICVKNFPHKQQYVLSLPKFGIHQLWFAVTVLMLGVVDNILKKHEKVTIFCQAAVYSALAPLLLRRYKEQMMPYEKTGKVLQYFDLGRVLDLADIERHQHQPWIRNIEEKNSFNIPFSLS